MTHRYRQIMKVSTAGLAYAFMIANAPPSLAEELAQNMSAEGDGKEAVKEKEKAKSGALNEVVITAPRMSEPLIVETDPKNPRQPIPPADGAGYLKNIPGFSVSRQGGIGGEPLLRSQGGSRLNITLDGAPLLGGCPNRMDPPTAYIFPESFDKLTVLKGPQSVVHGGSSLGSIMIERETPRFKELSMRGNASALYGTYDRNDYVLDASGGAQPGYVRMIGTRSSSDDYRDGNGNKVHSKYWRQSGTGIVGWTPNEDTTVEAIFDKSEAEAAYASNSMDGSQFDREGLTLRLTRKNLTPLFSKVNLTAYYNYADHIMDTYSLRRLTTMSTAASQVDHLMQGVKGKIELTPRNDTKVTLGVDYNQDIHSKRALTRTQYLAGMRIDDQVRATDMSFETIAGYGEVNHDLTNIDRLIGGYRFTRVEALRQIYYTDESNDRSLSSGFARYEHDFNVGVPLTTYLGAGHVQRAPDFWERGKSRAAFTINEEKTNQVDIGALFKSSNWQGSVSGFFAHHDDYILVSNTSGITPKNVDAHTFGGEADLSYSFLKSWSVEATLAYVRGYNDSEDKPLAQTSPLNSTLGVKYDDSVFIGGLLLRAVSGQDRVDVGWGNIMSRDLAQTGGFAVLSANLGWRPYQGVMITGGVDNILDKTYSEHISKTGTLNGAMSGNADYVDSVRVNEPGRTFWMRGSVKF